MASYINNNLMPGEEVIYEGKSSLWASAVWIALGVVLVLPALSGAVVGAIPGVLILVSVYLRYISTELAFTNKRVIAKFGFISRSTVELKIDRVESMQVNQGILGRIFNYGTLVVSGAGNPQAPIPSISSPMLFRNRFMEYQDKASPSAV